MSPLIGIIRRVVHIPDRFSMAQSLLIIVILSLGAKLAYILLLGGGLTTFPLEGSDAQFYDGAARVLLQTGVYGLDPQTPSVNMPPGQSVFLAVLYGVSSGSIAFARLAHVVVLTLAAVLTYLTGKRLFSSTIGFWAGCLIAIDPAQAYLSATFLSEPLFILLMMSGIYAVLRGLDAGLRYRWLIAAGLCFGLAGLTRNQGWAFPFALLLGALITRGRLLAGRGAVTILVVTLLVILPWTYRNYTVTGRLVPVSSEGGLTFWASNNPEFVFRQPMPMSLPIYAAPVGLSAVALNDYYMHKAWSWITQHPTEFAINGVRKLITLYHFDPASARPELAPWFRLAGIIPYGLLLPFIILGLITYWRHPRVGIVITYILYTTLLAVLFWGDSRVRAPIQPYLYLLASAWLVEHLTRANAFVVAAPVTLDSGKETGA